MEKKDGLQRLLDFMAFLNDNNTQFSVSQQSPEAVMISFALVRHRIEVEFFVNEMQYSIFKGDESVDVDEDALLSLIKRLSA